MKKTGMALGLWVFSGVLAFAQTGKIDFPPMAKTVSLSDTDSGEVTILPNPLVSGAYFYLKCPERKVLKRVEIVDTTGKRANMTEITFSKMGLYMPKMEKGLYVLKVSMDQDTVLKKVRIE